MSDSKEGPISTVRPRQDRPSVQVSGVSSVSGEAGIGSVLVWTVPEQQPTRQPPALQYIINYNAYVLTKSGSGEIQY